MVEEILCKPECYKTKKPRDEYLEKDDFPFNVGHLIVNELREFKLHDSPTLMFPSLITELCKWADAEYAGEIG
ncbi:hypothetical protein H5410_021736 [Solanum commersonii]|uniref:Uncharacterized protein n=1 Tax=Solanum commersonii TaxID=4109 RepID=A0A9J5ZES9_SOLCO|nr:hypothetical protein H5410_021736 [Solanum commersonii]